MENSSVKIKIFLNASIQEVNMLAEILAAEVIREKPKDPYKHLAMCLQTMIDIRDTTDFHEHMQNVATKKQATYRHYQPEYKRSLELLYEKAATSAIQEITNINQSDCNPPTASELVQINAATVIQRAYRQHRNFSCTDNDSIILSQEQQKDKIIEKAYKQHCPYEQDEIHEEQAALIIQEINRKDCDELSDKSKKNLKESVDESAMSTTSTTSSVDLEEKVPTWLENLMARRSSGQQASIIASNFKKGRSLIPTNGTSNSLLSYTKHSPDEKPTYESRNDSCELPASPKQYLEAKYDTASSNRTPPQSPYKSDDTLHLTRSKTPSSKNFSASKRAMTRNSSATRQQRKNPVNVSTDSRDLASCMTITSLSNTLQQKKCHSIPVNSTESSLTRPSDRPHSYSLPCIATSRQRSISATPSSSTRKSC